MSDKDDEKGIPAAPGVYVRSEAKRDGPTGRRAALTVDTFGPHRRPAGKPSAAKETSPSVPRAKSTQGSPRQLSLQSKNVFPAEATTRPVAVPAEQSTRRSIAEDRVGRVNSFAVRRASERPVNLSIDDKVQLLVDGLQTCGPGDENPHVAAFLRLGPNALPAIERAFPGLLWFHRHLAHKKLPRGRDTGPLAAVLLAFGEEAGPSVVRLLASSDSSQRFYAALVAADMLSQLTSRLRRTLASSLVWTVFDTDASVREAALHAIVINHTDQAVVDSALMLCEMALDETKPEDERILALRSLGVFRMPRAVPRLLSLLEHKNAVLRDTAYRVIKLIAVTDLPPSERKWRSWCEKSLNGDRTTWLLEGLNSRSTDIRALAVRDLNREVGSEQSFDDSSAGRQAARLFFEARLRDRRR